MDDPDDESYTHGVEIGYHGCLDKLNQHSTPCCLGDNCGVQAQIEIGMVKYWKEVGDKSVGIADYEYFELILKPGYKIVGPSALRPEELK